MSVGVMLANAIPCFSFDYAAAPATRSAGISDFLTKKICPLLQAKNLQPAHSSIVITLCHDFIVLKHLTNESDMANWTLQHHDGPPRAPQNCANIASAMRAAGLRRSDFL